jgi:hypothetical protein
MNLELRERILLNLKIVAELAQAQNRTKHRVEELTQAQIETNNSIKQLSDTIEFKLGSLGRRWGIDSESSFRSGLAEILSERGYKVINYVHNASGL